MTSQCLRAVRGLLAGAAFAGLLGLDGCSMLHWHHSASAKARPAASPSMSPSTNAGASAALASDAPSGETAGAAPTRTVTDTLESPSTEPDTEPTATTVVENVGPQLKASAPKNYVVRHGDTLWGIANMFLRDPWTWPEIWYVNPQIKNPHRIYPGDQLQLALGSDGRMALKLVRTVATSAAAPIGATARLRPLLRSSPLDSPIEAIPYGIIAAFLSHPTVLSADQIHSAPYVVALMENHNVAGTGHEIYIKQARGEAGARYSVMHVDQELVNPDNGRHLGYMAIYAGTAELTQAGPIAKAILTDAARETLQGDVLIPEDRSTPADLVPHVPDRPVSGRIMAVVDNVLLAGQDQVVAINRGSDDGLERGNVLTVDQAPLTVLDPCAMIENSSTCSVHPAVTLPTETAGTLLIFRTFRHMSYGLILNDTVPMQVGDHIHSP